MRANILYVGGVAVLSAEFRNAAGAPIDPTAVFLALRSPDHDGPAGEWEELLEYGVDAEIVRDEEGFYHADVDLADSTPGTWEYSWYSTGTGQAARAGQFRVEAILVAPPEPE